MSSIPFVFLVSQVRLQERRLKTFPVFILSFFIAMVGIPLLQEWVNGCPTSHHHPVLNIAPVRSESK